MDKKHWIKKEQLDTPLCDIFEDTETSETARKFIIESEKHFGMEHDDLESMSNEKLNEYIEFLDYLWEK